MMYFEILQWLQDNLLTITKINPNMYQMRYISPIGKVCTINTKDIISGVLEINEVDLVL